MIEASNDSLPVVVIGAGPVGLAAAAHLVDAGLPVVLFERGESAGFSVRAWSHVRMFTPWRYVVDSVARTLLEQQGWVMPPEHNHPTGGELLHHYLIPLSNLPELDAITRYGSEVIAVSRRRMSKTLSAGRESQPFVVHWRDASGAMQRVYARALLDASGTWDNPAPAGSDGLPVAGELACSTAISYGIPDISGRDQHTYRGRHTLLIGAGHSAINVALDLLRLQEREPATRLTWAIRRDTPDRLAGGGASDALPGRGELGTNALNALESGRIDFRAGFHAEQFRLHDSQVHVTARQANQSVEFAVDRIVVATGFRPNLDLLSELRLSIDPILQAPTALAPLIDPNLHSCGTVAPHGIDELSHPDAGVYIIGMKSYGRAPTFLLATGYEQLRSIVAELAGDPIAARRVALTLPPTGVCNGSSDATDSTGGCCGGPPRSLEGACCVADERIKQSGGRGCGCQ